MEQKWTCPECAVVFEAPQAETDLLTCPLCSASFQPALAPAAQPQPAPAERHAWTGAAAVAALVFVVGGLAWAYHLLQKGERKPVEQPRQGIVISHAASPAASPPNFEPHIVTEPEPFVPPVPSLPTRHPPVESPPKRSQPPSPPPLALRVNRAIDRGVEHLLRDWCHPPTYQNHVGLLGLTLLECGAPDNHPAVCRLADLMRKQKDLLRTYELALAILFLDRLGDPNDDRLIRTFAQRLLDGQDTSGAWGYVCLAHKPKPRAVRSPKGPAVAPWHILTDNSNTQFAILGLWVAQRHGVLVSPALDSAARYFRESQKDDGSWAYKATSNEHRHSMTCAGLLCLATERGEYVEGGWGRHQRNRVMVSDPAMTRGLRYLGKALDSIEAGGRIDSWGKLYFLWSLERVAAVYDLDRIGSREWYPWAAEQIVGMQRGDGSWAEGQGPVGTCFALLVLRRSNLTRDLLVGVHGLSRPRPPARVPQPPLHLGPTVVEKPASGLGPSISRKPGDRLGTASREELPPLRGGVVIPKAGD